MKKTLSVICRWSRNYNHKASDERPKFLLFPKTNPEDLGVSGHYEIVQSLEDFKVRTVEGGRWRRPELKSTFTSQCYNGEEAALYTQSHRSQRIQMGLTSGAVDLLNIASSLRSSKLILDVGCGSGISSQVILSAGFPCIGVDVSRSMLELFSEQSRHTAASVFSGAVMCDISKPLPLRAGTVDGAISISVLQWLFVLNEPARACRVFLKSLRRTLRTEGKAVVQFYPRSRSDVEMVCQESMEVFDKGALVGCRPIPDRGRKLYLLLMNS